MSEGPIKTAVVTGGHSFEVPAFHELFRALEGVGAYIQHMEDFCADGGNCRGDYDAVVFYHMFKDGPTDEGPWYAGKQRSALATLGQTPQGIFLLHHAILAYTDWPVWREIAGIDGNSFTAFDHRETIGVKVADADHPITRGLADWQITDETYTMSDADADGSSRILLTTDHPKSLRTLAWTRQYRSARVFCLQLGHDGVAFANEAFRTVVRRGIEWVAGRI
jgi:hypothetical protein